MSPSCAWTRLRALGLAALPAALVVGLAGQPVAHADVTADRTGVTVTLGPGQSQNIGKVVSTMPGTVTPVASCDPEVSTTFDANLVETIHVAPDATAGIFTCTVDFQIGGQSFGLVVVNTVHVPGLSLDDVMVAEGDTGTVPATFAVSLSEPSTASVTVHFATANGSATAPADYAAASGTVTFAPGQTDATVTVDVNGDTVDELDEQFAVELSAAVGAAVTDGQGVGTILDDDRDGVFSCRASGLDVGGVEPVLGNGPDAPCVADHQILAHAGLDAGLLAVTADGLDVSTDQTPDLLAGTDPAAGDVATSNATVSTVTISATLVSIELNTVTSQATAGCVSTPGGLVPRFTGSSSVAGLTINGVPMTVGSGPVDIPLAIGTLHLNSTTVSGDSVTRRAVWLHTALTDVVVAESTAGVHGTAAHPGGNPCVTR